ncbi:MerR family transcriptional regulator [Halobacillus sp. A5]|uniref:MerR family transcriptional regulator n=1 Tax=Halobacillus sp. A5 TaxID=2880263 RepID=UPI0020A659C7|nr:MerR family transcriptional regulator [Halobacillus sp. A5]MCP3025764.1 MerR family transcriptional regulator [Halobacillus sp. A5]
MSSYKDKKVITIGIVNEITGLTCRMIRYYESRGLIFPERTERGTRKYSFSDIELLMDIADKREEGIQTYEIKKELLNDNKKREVRDNMIQGQLNAQFNMKKL